MSAMPIRPGDWAASIDLRDAYFHVPIHPADRKFIRFGWRGCLYQFCVLPFGLSPAPRIFTLLMKKVKAKLGRLGIRTIFYLDDILVLGTSYLNCLANLQRALSILMQAGFLINWEKSCIVPMTSFTFLGMVWNFVEGTLALPENKLLQLQSQAAFLLDCVNPSCRQVMILTGLVAAYHKAVPLLRLKSRYIQLSLNSSYSSVGDLLGTVTFLPEARRDLRWILQLHLSDCRGHLWPLTAEDCTIEVQTDASGRGFGIWFQGRLHSEEWDGSEGIDTLTHINGK
jgi:hypothetical protein